MFLPALRAFLPMADQYHHSTERRCTFSKEQASKAQQGRDRPFLHFSKHADAGSSGSQASSCPASSVLATASCRCSNPDAPGHKLCAWLTLPEVSEQSSLAKDEAFANDLLIDIPIDIEQSA